MKPPALPRPVVRCAICLTPSPLGMTLRRLGVCVACFTLVAIEKAVRA